MKNLVGPAQPPPPAIEAGRQPQGPGLLQKVAVARVFQLPVVGLGPVGQTPAGGDQQHQALVAQYLGGGDPGTEGGTGLAGVEFQAIGPLEGFQVVQEQQYPLG